MRTFLQYSATVIRAEHAKHDAVIALQHTLCIGNFIGGWVGLGQNNLNCLQSHDHSLPLSRVVESAVALLLPIRTPDTRMGRRRRNETNAPFIVFFFSDLQSLGCARSFNDTNRRWGLISITTRKGEKGRSRA